MRVGGFCMETGRDGIRKFNLHIQEIKFSLSNLTSEFHRTVDSIGVMNKVIEFFYRRFVRHHRNRVVNIQV